MKKNGYKPWTCLGEEGMGRNGYFTNYALAFYTRNNGHFQILGHFSKLIAEFYVDGYKKGGKDNAYGTCVVEGQ